MGGTEPTPSKKGGGTIGREGKGREWICAAAASKRHKPSKILYTFPGSRNGRVLLMEFFYA